MAWTTRLAKEREGLSQFFPQFRIQDPDGPRAGVLGRMRTNSGTEYVIWLLLRGFPNEAPQMYILSPERLSSYDGQALADIGVSQDMHLLTPDSHGHPQICHYNGKYWHPKVSLYKILMKARLWLEAYEQHRRRGQPLDSYLGHMH